jgi:hypothetical protein
LTRKLSLPRSHSTRTPILLLVTLSACVDPSVGIDRDGDGFFTSELDGDDCDDSNANVNPDDCEACASGIDDDGNGIIDDAGVGERTWFVDSDQDGFAGPVQFTGCAAPAGAFADLSLGEDCDDTRSDINPGADEVWYDGVDQDCAEDDDNDADGDGFVAMSQGGDDCADDNAGVNPDAVEVCNNGVDDDCDGGPNQCEYSGEVDLEAMASTVFATESSKQWLDDFNGDGVMDVLLQVDKRQSPRNRLEVYFGPLQSLELQPDAIIWGPLGSDWDRNDNLASIVGDYNGDGMTDIIIAGPYPEEEGSSIRIFTSPFESVDLDDGDEAFLIEWINLASQRRSLHTDSLSAVRTSPTATADALMWIGRPNLVDTAIRLFEPSEMGPTTSLISSPSLSEVSVHWLPERLTLGTPTPTIILGTNAPGTPRPVSLSRLTVNDVGGGVQLEIEAWRSSVDPTLYDSMAKEGRFDLDDDGSLDLMIGRYTLTDFTGVSDEFSWPMRIASGTIGRLPVVGATPPVVHIADTFGLYHSLTVCDITGGPSQST